MIAVSGDAFPSFNSYFSQIVARYKDTIVGQFFGKFGKKILKVFDFPYVYKMSELMRFISYLTGHTHWDEFQVIYDYHNGNEPRPVGVGYMAPSVTTFRNVNPAFR